MVIAFERKFHKDQNKRYFVALTIIYIQADSELKKLVARAEPL